MNPKYPIYIISKGRWEHALRLTSRVLEAMNTPYHIVIEPQEYEQYAAVLNPTKILVLPFSNLGLGGIPARNWVWDHATAEGHARHWILDDNIRSFYRLHNNQKIRAGDGTVFRAAEDFVDRYTNVPMAGFQYEMFAKRKDNWKPFHLNTRIYSCILLQNGLGYQWRGRYNEDTDLSLRFLKAGYCTVLFYAFLADKVRTLYMKGGNTDQLYKQDAVFDGRLAMAQSLQRQHPNVVKIAWKWGRWQHQVDYRPFKANKLIKRDDVVIPEGVNDYGMRVVQVSPARG